MVMPSEHTCACYVCDPETFPTPTTRAHPDHVASCLPGDVRSCDVFLDGDRLLRCFEADARAGWAVIASRTPEQAPDTIHACRNHHWELGPGQSGGNSGAVCVQRVTGAVEVRRKVPA